jgi:hypothetical protein
LIEYSHGEGWEDGEENVIKGQRPRFVDYLSGECVLEGVLNTLVASRLSRVLLTQN